MANEDESRKAEDRTSEVEELVDTRDKDSPNTANDPSTDSR
jgi:hypothetical protein